HHLVYTPRPMKKPAWVAWALSLGWMAACGGGQGSSHPASPPVASTSSEVTTGSHARANSPEAARGAAHVDVPPAIRAMVEANDRLPEDRALDAGRHPGEMLAFFGVQPGWHVAEVAAGGGYTTEFLARAVGPTGKVYGVNSKMLLERFAEKPWSARL